MVVPLRAPGKRPHRRVSFVMIIARSGIAALHWKFPPEDTLWKSSQNARRESVATRHRLSRKCSLRASRFLKNHIHFIHNLPKKSPPMKMTTPAAYAASLGMCALAVQAAEQPSPPQLPPINIVGQSFAEENTPPAKEKFQLPQTSQSVTAERIQETVNVVDTEDAIKYFPSLFVRKRNYGDTQPVLATRTWGLGSSARSLVYADDLLLTALIANNNTLGAPRWGLVTPEEIERIDFLYGPFAAAYPGNAAGGVLQISTKMPEKFSGTILQTEAFQTFNRYGTKDTFQTDQTNLSLGGKNGAVAWLVTGGFQNSYSQPLSFVTNGSVPSGTTGTFIDKNKLGQVADVVGASGLLHTEMANIKGKVAWDVTDWLKATYQIALWNNDATSEAQTYLKDAAGKPTFGGVGSTSTGGGFANGFYTLNETHLANAFSLKTDTKGAFDWDFSISNYYYLEDIQRNPFGVTATGAAYTTYGKIARLDGTNWTNGDLKGIWRPTGLNGPHEVNFGLHGDRYYLNNPTYKTSVWNGGPDSTSVLYTNSKGITKTGALWLQDAWRFAPHFKLTTGGRLETWEASNGFNLITRTYGTSGAIGAQSALNQPNLDATRFSPKISMNWTPSAAWELTGSFGQAYRFPTVGELYQITTGVTPFNPNPNLKPENILSSELALQRKFEDGFIRVSLFNENVRQALISQTIASGTFVDNVDKIRNTGIELAAQKDNVTFKGLSLFGSVTYVDSHIEKDSSWTGAVSVVDKHVPYVPDWRATLGATMHIADKWAFTSAMRYSGRQYSTLDNSDNTKNVFGAFDRFLVFDAKIQYKVCKNATLNVGIDNVADTKYTLYHPFPGRTFTSGIKVDF